MSAQRCSESLLLACSLTSQTKLSECSCAQQHILTRLHPVVCAHQGICRPGHKLTWIMRALAAAKSSISRAETRVAYRRNSSQPALSEIAVSLLLHCRICPSTRSAGPRVACKHTDLSEAGLAIQIYAAAQVWLCAEPAALCVLCCVAKPHKQQGSTPAQGCSGLLELLLEAHHCGRLRPEHHLHRACERCRQDLSAIGRRAADKTRTSQQ